ncbi:MAG: Crp/Fnr family transcriptional regulator [Pedobacter sp.]|nr:Crp/Fnr family transcriptional regulator [Pedobacter sp.]
MEHTLNTIKSIYPLQDKHLQLLYAQLKRIELPKNHLIFHAQKVERSLYFIEKGIARAYLDGMDNRITFWFGMEGDVMFSYHSYINGKPGYENIELLENSILYELKTDSLIQLFNTHTELANWGRKLAELELIKTEERYIARLFKSASERYQELQASYPALINRIQLGHIASYLGVTQVTLSRIRSENK